MTAKQLTRAELIKHELELLNRRLDMAGSPNAGRYIDIQQCGGYKLALEVGEHHGAEDLSQCMTGAAFYEMLRAFNKFMDAEAQQ